jgi:hypothetical protein
MRLLSSFNPPADGVETFPINPDLFRAYAQWKKKTRFEVLGRDVVDVPYGQAVFVWYRLPKKKGARGRAS